MKSRFLLWLAATVFGAAALTASAQTVAAGDIIVGFRGAAGVANNLEIKAGSVSTLQAYSSQTLIGNFNTSLNALSSSWTTASTLNTGGLLWGAVGSSSSSLVYATSGWDTTVTGTLGTANSVGWSSISSGLISTANTNITSLRTGFNNSATATGDSLSKTIAASNTNSWSTKGTTGAAGFGVFNPNTFNGVNGLQVFGSSNANNATATFVATDLYSVQANSSTYLGTFALYTSSSGGYNVGDLTFTAAASAIPEPSTYAALAGVAALGLVMVRRRQARSQEQA